MPPALTHDGDVFIYQCGYGDRKQARDAGFKWSGDKRAWYTSSPVVAARLREFATENAKSKLNAILIEITPWTRPLPPSPPGGFKLAPHQVESVLFALGRSRSYLRLDPGLGKTPVAATVALALRLATVYVSPAFLVGNVLDEFRRWAPDLTVDIYRQEIYDPLDVDVLLLPDSLLLHADLLVHVARYARGDSLLIVDEAHRFKSDTAKRTKALFGDKHRPGLSSLFSRQVYLSGTPMPNRPIELFALLQAVAPECIDFMSKYQYAGRYCAAYRGPFGIDMSGASNMPELERRLVAPDGPFMLRQKKELLNLPPKTEEVFVLSASMSRKLTKMDEALGRAYRSVEDLLRHRLASAHGVDDLHTTTYRRLLGAEKVKAVAAYVQSILEDGEAVLVFAYHKEVVSALAAALSSFRPFVITGDTPVERRFQMVKDFQASPVRNLFIGNYLAMGVGFNLTKATRVFFAEYDWVPGTNDQASDRPHRIGQTKSVLVQYATIQDSLDKRVLETLLRKRKATAHI